jgi:intracellular septation protein A
VPKCFILGNAFVNCVVILAHEMTWIKFISRLVGPLLFVFTLTNGKVLGQFKSLEHDNS